MSTKQALFLGFVCLLSSSQLHPTGADQNTGESPAPVNPFTPKASLVRYWDKRIDGDSTKPTPFFLSKASPLSAVDSTRFVSLASRHALHTRLRDFCTAAVLFCFPELANFPAKQHDGDVNFSVYTNKNFTNYGSNRLAGAGDEFKNYSTGDNIAIDSFRRYSRDSAGHSDGFSTYADDANVADQSFNTYGAGSTGGSGDFTAYLAGVNGPNGRFTSYSDDANGRSQSFTSYSSDANAGVQAFTSYSKNGNGAPNEFSGYGTGSNVVQSDFSGYGQTANGENDTFTSYGTDGNIPVNNFRSYGDGGNGGVYGFKSYRDDSNIGADSFSSYAKNSDNAKIDFENYAKSVNLGSDNFTSYGHGAQNQETGFKSYGPNPNFKEYTKNDVVFSRYTNSTSASGKTVNKWVEPGKFFREAMLREGTLMQMPDIRDKMPRRTFLPRAITAKLPFSSSTTREILRIFSAAENSSISRIISYAVAECERPPSRGEVKRCVGSAEDMIDFATSMLGRHVAVRTTESVAGSKGTIEIGKVNGINGGKVTRSVSCHQTLYPYLLYYCHSVPRVRVYEVDLLDPKSRVKINHGVAICHVDTSAWSPGHGAFLALGPGPGRIEVCHWIFENDMTWIITKV
ncbi:PREDICTED: polygalacturonase 1 beta-like protein 2 [Tarenaya hassleriana]|uniref:polygalacturonase 1 beta-like protein 2 n=1 Tax=Tarenaya hassleriana TaxID=28532 RepID=UPI00053C9E47|nr:PREDICTED: polygalacturonase 1 beta-like protein 2 [Tarenaya hassleriana]